MRRITAGMLVALAGLAVAAPVPKFKPAFGDFGDLTDPKTKCKCDLSKDGTLSITVPTTHPPLDPSTEDTRPPLIARVIEGNFSVKTRLTIQVPATAKPTAKSTDPTVVAGVNVSPVDVPKDGMTCGVVMVSTGGEWRGGGYEYHYQPGDRGSTGMARRLNPTDSVYVRITRIGDRFTTELSGDGSEWVSINTFRLTAVSGPVRVGPTIYGCIDQEFTATFDQYEIKPLTKDEKK